MSDNRNIRINTKLLGDKISRLNINLEQDFDSIEILSLKIDKENAMYGLHTSNYGCIAGRVIANKGFGIPNAKVSVFIERDGELDNDSLMRQLYPYSGLKETNSDGIRYNLLPEEGGDDCYQPVGSFPSKRLVLDDELVLEMYDKYYRYTTRTNNSGDYMIFGIPTGMQKVHCDVDLSDCGMLSQKPRDFVAQGYGIDDFESPNMFRKSTNIDSLPQIVSEDKSIDVYPFWGEESENGIAITRCDFDVNYNFQSSCVFIGSIFSDTENDGLSVKCVPNEEMGVMSKLETGRGTIEMIRKAPDDNVEEYQVNSANLIDENGTWCYQIPMNLDYVMTDEYGNMVPSEDPSKGIATRARVRFRISISDNGSEYKGNNYVKILVPNNPKTEDELDYIFGTNTLDDEFGTKSFRDLFWNKVYTVKSYIPRIQEGNDNDEMRFTGIKGVNEPGDNNPFPYNAMRTDIVKSFRRECNRLHDLVWWTAFINRVFKTHISIGDGLCPELKGWYFAPGVKEKNLGKVIKEIKLSKKDANDKESSTSEEDDEICATSNMSYFMKCAEMNMAKKYNLIQFDFYNDWINGCIYIPRWFRTVTQKKSYLFGLVKVDPKVESCTEKSQYGKYKTWVQQCSLTYAKDGETGTYTNVVTPVGCLDDNHLYCHRREGRRRVKILQWSGLVHEHQTYKEEMVYYAKPCEWNDFESLDEWRIFSNWWIVDNKKTYSPVNKRKRVLLFATDIVMLGSFNAYDTDGMSELLPRLKNTTFQLPEGVVSTNLGHRGLMLGTDGVLCSPNGTPQPNGVVKYDDTFEAYEKWSGKSDLTESSALDKLDYGVSLVSGINWSYRGPNQPEDNRSASYFPGGHFLGISCGSMQTSIKSCANLSRICEIGVEPSQRHSIVIDRTREGESKPTYGWSFIVPNGLISRDEIIDREFRTVFATMNINALRTKRNEDARLVYDLSYVNPDNFNGELKYKVVEYPDVYNGYIGYDDILKQSAFKYYAYKRSMENTSKDYYHFRMGINNNSSSIDDEYRKHYLLENGNSVSLPIYENSYYFYFGLKKGNTALDRFFKEYYSLCPDKNSYRGRFNVSVTKPLEYCNRDKGTTSVEVDIFDIDGPYVVYLYKNDVSVNIKIDEQDGNIEVNESEGASYVEINKRIFEIKGLGEGEYNLTIGGIRTSSYSEEFSVIAEIPEPLKNINFESVNFTDKIEISGKIISFYNYVVSDLNTTGNWAYDSNSPEYDALNEFWHLAKIGDDPIYSRKQIGGYFLLPKIEGVINFEGYVIASTRHFKTNYTGGDIDWSRNEFTKNLEELDFNNIEEPLQSFKPTAWEGNTRCTIYAIWNCGVKKELIPLDAITVTMDGGPDVFYGNESITHNKALSALGKHGSIRLGWWSDELEFKDTKFLKTDKMKWIFKRGTFYTKSFYQNSPISINSGFINVKNGDKTKLTGTAEKVLYDEDNEQTIYSLLNTDTDNIYCPKCGALLTVTSGTNEIKCKECDWVGTADEALTIPSGYKIDLSSIYVPMCNCEYDNGELYWNMVGDGEMMSGYTTSGLTTQTDKVKQPYIFSYNNKNFSGETWQHVGEIPVLYRPFYSFNYLLVTSDSVDNFDKSITLISKAVNGISAKKDDGNSYLGTFKYRIGDEYETYLYSGEIPYSDSSKYRKINYAFVEQGHVQPYDQDYVGTIIRNHETGIQWGVWCYEDKPSPNLILTPSLEGFFGCSTVLLTNKENTTETMKTKYNAYSASVQISDSKYEDTGLNNEIITKEVEKTAFLGADSFDISSKGVRYYKVCLNNFDPFRRTNYIDKKVGGILEYKIDFTHNYGYVISEPSSEDWVNAQIKWERTGKTTEVNGWIYFQQNGNRYFLPKYWRGIFTYCLINEDRKYLLEEINVEEANPYNLTNYVCIGLLDQWTKLTNEQISEGGRFNYVNEKYRYTPKHVSDFSIIRSYRIGEFSRILMAKRGEANEITITQGQIGYSYELDGEKHWGALPPDEEKRDYYVWRKFTTRCQRISSGDITAENTTEVCVSMVKYINTRKEVRNSVLTYTIKTNNGSKQYRDVPFYTPEEQFTIEATGFFEIFGDRLKYTLLTKE